MILLFGGTTEGKRCAQALSGAGLPFLYSTKTKVEVEQLPGMHHIQGALETAELVQLCRRENIRCIVNASHPFAERLHATIAHAATLLALPVLRFERRYPSREPVPDLRFYAADFVESLRTMESLSPKILFAATGVQTIARLRSWWIKHTTYFQILDRESSFELAVATGFPKARLLGRAPWQDAQSLAAFLDEYRINAVLTKESGESGSQSVKEEAALLAGIPIIIIKRPVLPVSFVPVHREDELLKRLTPSHP